jgi:hypothetical protein
VLSWELAERSWCRQEGLLRQKWRLDDGRCVDVRVCGLLRREYEGENGPGS